MAAPRSPDYIIIGGGTSGLVVASRLAEDPNMQVLVLEAGKDFSADPRVNVPAFFTTLMGSDADWQYKTVPQQRLKDRVIGAPQGKALGGSSAINGQAFIAPSQAEVDAWAQLGNPGWDWAGLVPFFKKFYTLIPPPDQETRGHLGIDWINDDFRGTSGPIKVSFPGVLQNPLAKAWIDAFCTLNSVTTGGRLQLLTHVDARDYWTFFLTFLDPFSGNSLGAYSNAATVDPETKTRSYAGNAFGIQQKENIQIVTEAQVQSILLSASASGAFRATGVQVLVGGKSEEFTAAKEIILAAGVSNTPRLLELSGIGRKDVLEKHKIPVLVDLPGVGENLQDHLMTGLSYEVVDGVVTGDPLLRQEPEAMATAQKLYFEHKAGPFNMGGMQSHAFMDTQDAADVLKNAVGQPRRPEEQEQFDILRGILEKPDATSGAWLMFLAQANLHEGASSFVGSSSKLHPENFASLGCIQSHPFSRGSTHITSSDPGAPPAIDPRCFSHPADLEIFACHVRDLDTRLRLAEPLAKYFKPYGKRNHLDAFHVQDLEGA